MGALPSSLKEELIACRALTSGRILFRVLQTYQPGGSSERSSTLKQLTMEYVAKDAREATEYLRRWKRHQQRAEELSVTLPDTTLLVKSLSTLVSAVLVAAPQANFRVNAYRMHSRVDMRPTVATLQEFYTLLLAEMETLVLAPENGAEAGETKNRGEGGHYSATIWTSKRQGHQDQCVPQLGLGTGLPLWSSMSFRTSSSS